MDDRFALVHGHFYQPPREHPLTQEMPREYGAAPYHDFNEKIFAECYRQNAELGNFTTMSFNIGPTLATWMRRHHPDVLQRIASSDRAAVLRHGNGSAMAQSYHHTILPLANPRDRRTEIRWGIRSFELLFGRQPLGIWLPETAVDTATLEDCLAEGLRFTVLAPSQVGVAGTPNGAYRLPLGGDRSFEAIVYDGGLGGLVSFDPQATTWADQFAATHVAPRFDYIQERPALVAIATDGEVYGHHHKFKDYFVQDLLSNRLSAVGITPVTAEQYVVQHPANRLAVLHERSSWGCPHHLARWSTGCSCTEGSADWKQALRDAFDHLATQIDTLFERVGCLHLHDPWAARDAYIDVVDGAVAFDEWYGNWNPGAGDRATAHLLLEAQRHRLAMYASCAFYWEDVDRLEPGYGIQRGLTAAGMLDGAFDTMFAAGFRRHLTHAIGWRSHQSAAELHAAG